MVDIEDKWQFQNELAYIVRNPFVAMKDVNPLAYPWCSGYLYFNAKEETRSKGLKI